MRDPIRPASIPEIHGAYARVRGRTKRSSTAFCDARQPDKRAFLKLENLRPVAPSRYGRSVTPC
jgi:hypothetical protein